MKKLAILGVLWVLPLLIGQLNFDLAIGQSVQAADAGKKKTRKVPAMRETTYRKLSEAQVMIDPESAPREEGEPAPEPSGTPQDAVRLLLKLQERRGLNSYEMAQIWNTLAFAYYVMEDIPNTIRSYEMILKQGTISEALEFSSLRALFQLHYAEENYRKSIEFINQWQALKEIPDAQVNFIEATAYYQLDDLRNSIKHAIETEEIALSQQKDVKENWWYLQVVVYNDLDDIDKVIEVLEKLIEHYPKKQYWMHLAGMYSEKEWDDKALSAYYTAYVQGFFKKESEVVMLSQRLLSMNNLYEATEILEKGFKDEIIEEDEKNLRLLATAYTMSQEYAQAIDAWRDAARYAEDGELQYRLAQALASEDRHKEAITAYRAALKKGEVRSEADVNFWLGISLMQLERWDQATRAFRDSSRKDKKRQKQARQYIRYIAGEKRRQRELKKMLEG